jgi:hypothetical protein
VRKALAGEPLTIAGEGLQSRRFVYVEDLAEGVVRGLAPGAAGRTYNLVGDESVSVRGIADTVRGLVGDVDIVHVPARAADFAGAEISGERAAAELDWRPATPFREGVRRYIAWNGGEPAPARRAAQPSRRRWAPGLVSVALSLLTVITAAGMLGAYLAAVHAIGVTGPEDRTVAVMSMGALAAYLMVAVDAGAGRRSVATFSGWAILAAVVVTVLMPELRETLGLAGPDESIDLLGIAGGALGIGLADAGLRLRRNGGAAPRARV